MDQKTIRENEDNNKKFLTGELLEEEKKKKKKNKDGQFNESVEEAPLEYFTE